MKIEIFFREHAFLSNFFPAEVLGTDGLVYPTVEHAYQAAKTLLPRWRAYVLAALTPAEAKRRGRYVPLRSDWDAVKEDVMRELLRQKFTAPDLRERLLLTDSAELVEGNSWGDRYWGVCNGVGQNRLGVLLMELRAELQRNAEARQSMNGPTEK